VIRYRTYGLTIAADAPIAGLVAIDDEGAIDCIVHFSEGGDCGRRSPNHRFEYSDGTRFVVADDGSEVWCSWESSAEDAATFLLGPILAFVVRLRGSLALHASAVVANGRAFVFAAPAGGGKSTLAATFARHGHSVLSDDVVRLEIDGDRVMAIPGYPLVRLWDDVTAEFYGSAEALPLLTPTWTKRYLDLRSGNFHDAPALVAAIYILGERRDAVAIEPLRGAAAAIALITNSSMNLSLGNDLRARELDLVARVVELVAVRELHLPHDLRSIERVFEALLADNRDVSP
jgi:hypothetical protein